jgi:hypothetical protein
MFWDMLAKVLPTLPLSESGDIMAEVIADICGYIMPI